MSIGTGACTCSITRAGTPAGCSAIDVIDTAWGPRFQESACAPRGDGSFVAAALAREDRAAKAARADAAPAGSWTSATPRAGLAANGWSYTREGSPVVCEGGMYRRR